MSLVEIMAVHGDNPLTHHPLMPDVPLRAGQALRRGDVCWIDEDGQVYPITVLADWRGPYDGAVAETYAAGQPCALLTHVYEYPGGKIYY